MRTRPVGWRQTADRSWVTSLLGDTGSPGCMLSFLSSLCDFVSWSIDNPGLTSGASTCRHCVTLAPRGGDDNPNKIPFNAQDIILPPPSCLPSFCPHHFAPIILPLRSRRNLFYDQESSCSNNSRILAWISPAVACPAPVLTSCTIPWRSISTTCGIPRTANSLCMSLPSGVNRTGCSRS